MENIISPKQNGFRNLFLGLFLILSPFLNLIVHSPLMITGSIIGVLVGLIWLIGLIIVNPNQTKVLVFFGKYSGTISEDGFYWVNPFYSKKKVSLRIRNLETGIIKVNDEGGNPILISSVVVWKVVDTYKAIFDLETQRHIDSKSGVKTENREESYQNFIKIQAEAALRSISYAYPYDNLEEESNKTTLRSGGDIINKALKEEISKRLLLAGIEVQEARISNLSYAPEIAAVMLQRQQAQAIIGARKKIVEGSVGIVQMALSELEGKIDINPDQKANMISNLLVVLSSENGTTPVIQAGS